MINFPNSLVISKQAPKKDKAACVCSLTITTSQPSIVSELRQCVSFRHTHCCILFLCLKQTMALLLSHFTLSSYHCHPSQQQRFVLLLFHSFFHWFTLFLF
ncbi:hypothetical protein RJT34_07831 [Clitoria ternatea]|uniref:Uncharacterized protein n=1 Tax=Clitoria ternatea TaxID=43366 RepID=A0AAN9K5S5_CLITE